MKKEAKPKIDSLSYFQAQTEILMGQYRASKIVNHPGSKGDEAEEILKNFLKKTLAKKYAIGKGQIINSSKASYSTEQDIVIYDAHNCPLVYSGEGVQIFPIESVLVVIEVKSRIAIKSEPKNCDILKFIDSTSKLRNIRKLYKQKPASILFGFEGTDLNDLRDKFCENVISNNIDNCPNAIFILNSGSIMFQTLVTDGYYSVSTAAVKGADLHTRYKESRKRDDTLLIFYTFLQKLLTGMMATSTEPDMMEYFDSWKNTAAGAKSTRKPCF